MSWNDVCKSVCPVDWTLTVIGDRWVLLIMRELGMGVHRFDAIQAQTGMSSHMLSGRLRVMEHHGLIDRRMYESRPKRYEYHKTERGRELDPLIMLLRSYGRKWRGDPKKGEPAVALRDKKTGKLVDSLSEVSDVVEDFRFSLLEKTVGPSFLAEREKKAQAFKEARGQVEVSKKKVQRHASAPARRKKPEARPSSRV
jgi:DNA-binding HxlR family transcriptional regulator